MSLTIGITYCKKWSDYESWIKRGMEDAKVIKLETGNASLCDGIILTGGEDVNPALYGKKEYIEQYNLSDINPQRDDYEFHIIQYAEENNVPVLGICRGLQLVNVYYGGTLIPDLPSFNKTGHSEGKNDSIHKVELEKKSRLYQIVGEIAGEINSHHHQSAEKPGKGLIVTARSTNGVIEGMEIDDKNSVFYILVQWHPERLDSKNPFSGKLRSAFLIACGKHKEHYDLIKSVAIS